MDTKNSFLILAGQRLTIVGLFLLVLTSRLFASGTLSGFIKDQNTGEVLPGASIMVVGTSIGTASNMDGYFMLKPIPAGNITVQVSFIGYQTARFELEVANGANINKTFNLVPDGLEVGEVVVTAQARGQMQAINAQLTSREIKNVVSSDKIQDIPDANAAESIGRLPGVSINREGGEGNTVIIRGLPPEHSSIKIEGISMASTDQGNRSVNLSMISPYSLDGIEVVKAITPDMDADAMGGAVNFKLKKADEGLHGFAGLQGGYNGLSEQFGDFLASAALGNRFLDNRLGLLVQGNYEQRSRDAETEQFTLVNEKFDVTKNTDTLRPSGYLYRLTDRKVKRAGVTAIIDYRIKNGNIALNNVYNTSATNVQNFSQSLGWGGDHSINGSVADNNLKVISNSLKYEQDIWHFRVESGLARSYSENNSPHNYSWGFPGKSHLDSVNDTWHYNTLIQYIDTSRMDNMPLGGIGHSKSINAELKYEVYTNLKYYFNLGNWFSGSVKTGFKWQKMNRIYDRDNSDTDIGNSAAQLARNYLISQSEFVRKHKKNGELSVLPYSWFIEDAERYGLGGYPVPDADILTEICKIALPTDEFYSDTASGVKKHYTNSIKNDYFGSETLSAAYLMGEFNVGKYLTVIPGVRYESSSSDYTATQGNSDLAFPQLNYIHDTVSCQRTHSHLLPMLHLRLKPLSWFDIRLAYTNTLSRPSFSDIIPRYTINQASVEWNNVDLKPATSENIDLYLSFHHNKLGLFTVGTYSKNISGMVFNTGSRIITDSSYSASSLDYYKEFGLPDFTVGKTISHMVNNPNVVKIIGLEAEWQTNLYWLPGLLKGLVLNINYTYSQSEAVYPVTRMQVSQVFNPETYEFDFYYKNIDSSYTARYLKQPDHVLNITLGYDYKDFSARASMLYQSKTIQGYNRNYEEVIVKDSYLRFDILMKQKLSFIARGLEVYANLSNLNNRPDYFYYQGEYYQHPVSGGRKNEMQRKELYGAVIDLGVRYKF